MFYPGKQARQIAGQFPRLGRSNPAMRGYPRLNLLHPINFNLAGWWPFDQIIGTTTTPNIALNGSVATLTNISGTNPILVNGRIGMALQFDGVRNWVALGIATGSGSVPTALQLSRNFTMAAWIYPTSVSGNHAIICLNRGGGAYLRITGSSLDFLSAFTADVISGGTIVANVWSHVAVTVGSGSTAVMTLYINGKSVASTSSTRTFGTSGYSAIGAQVNTASDVNEVFPGLIDDPRVIANALIPSQVYSLYADTTGALGLISPRMPLVGTSAPVVTSAPFLVNWS